MFDSFVATVPSKMLKQRETTTQEQIFTEPDTRLAKEGGNIDTVLVTCPRSLHKSLVENSKREGVSMNQYCVYLLSRNDMAHRK